MMAPSESSDLERLRIMMEELLVLTQTIVKLLAIQAGLEMEG